MQGLGALHERALVDHFNCVKQKVSRYFKLGGKSWGTDAQADSFRAYLEDSKCSHVMFKDSQVPWCGLAWCDAKKEAYFAWVLTDTLPVRWTSCCI